MSNHLKRMLLLISLAIFITVDSHGFLHAELSTDAKACPKSGRKVEFRFEPPRDKPVMIRRRWWTRVCGTDTAVARARVRIWRTWRSGAITVQDGLWTVSVYDGENLLAIGQYVVNARD